MKFLPGQIVTTGAVHYMMTEDMEFSRFVRLSLTRHLYGDWGVVPDEDRVDNELALLDDERLVSAYDNNDLRIWIITDADRSVTTILFPSEY